MLDLRRWSLARLIVTSLLWIVIVPLLVVGSVALRIYIETRNSGSSGIGGVYYGGEGWLALAVLFGPPLIVAVLWIVSRRSAAQQ
jgi:hypothetical protein